MLLASVSGCPSIEMRHWARAQQIVEGWRENLHNLIEQVQSTQQASKESELEDKIVDVLKSIGDKQITVRTIHADHLRKYSVGEIESALVTLERNGIASSCVTARTKYYRFAGEASEATV
jgi:hypothetical protein